IGLIVVGSPAAYVLTRSTSRWSNRTYYLFLIAILLPTQLGIVPLYVEARNLGLTGSPWGMIVVYTGVLMPLSVFLYCCFFRRLHLTGPDPGPLLLRPQAFAPGLRGRAERRIAKATRDTVLTGETLLRRPEGLGIALTVPWYRSLSLSSVSGIAVAIDGRTIP